MKKIRILAIMVLCIFVMSMTTAIVANSTQTELRVSIDKASIKATYNCYFVNPTAGQTLSGTVQIDFYGTYNGAKLYTVKVAVYKNNVAQTSWTSMTYSSGNHWVINWDTSSYTDGSGYQLRAQAYRTSSRYSTFNCNNLVIANGGGGGGGGSWGTGGKYAIIVGISDYGYINDLSYCDEDATDWYNQLNSKGYECHVYGDGHTSNYPRYDGKATEATVRTAIQELADHAQSGDTVCFITSGHGSGNGAGSSYLCMWDCSGSQGCYYDTEIKADIGGFASGVKVFVFIDHCYSGGIGPDLMALSIKQYIYCTTTCTQNGYGYDDSTHKNGAWTYYFLAYSWQQHYGSATHQSMESIFSYALNAYPHGGGDTPQQYDGNTGSSFYLG